MVARAMRRYIGCIAKAVRVPSRMPMLTGIAIHAMTAHATMAKKLSARHWRSLVPAAVSLGCAGSDEIGTSEGELGGSAGERIAGSPP